MVVLEGFGLAAMEVFDYNRENYSFDNDQRILKEKTRLSMQIERFKLFREDVEDLVELTVSKMDMYHAVAALLLGSAATLYTEGRMHVPGNCPPWYTSIYLISIAGAFCYLILAVWLSMYASVASHSYGVRLRTRFVRLPIPSLAQLNAITAKFEQFEKQGVGNVLRLPFGPRSANDWRLDPGAAASSNPSSGVGLGGNAKPTALDDWLGAGEAAFGKQENLVSPATADGMGQHVKLFRRLQSKWQCYDAYARVSMAMGINHLLQAVTYYLLGCTLIENHMLTTAIALFAAYQSASLALCYLDLAGVTRFQIGFIQLLGFTPPLLILISLACADRTEQGLLKIQHFEPSKGCHSEPVRRSEAITPFAFWIEVIWFEALLWAARPSDDDEAALPRRFRSVLFLDVFGDGSYDPTDAEQALPPKQSENQATRHTQEQTRAASAERAVVAALAALRRWEAVPQHLLSKQQTKALTKYRQDYDIWRRAFAGWMVQSKGQRGLHHHDHMWLEESGSRAWADLPVVEQEHEAFACFLLGPLDGEGQQGFYDLEASQVLYDNRGGGEMLTLRMVAELVRKTELAVQAVLSKTSGHDFGEPESESDSDEDGPMDESTGVRRTNSGLPTKVERLPWKTMRRMTRWFQICWIFLGIMNELYLHNCGLDTYRSAGSDKAEGHFRTREDEFEKHEAEEAKEEGEVEEDGHKGEPIKEGADGVSEEVPLPAEHSEEHARRLERRLSRRSISAAVVTPLDLHLEDVEIAWPFGSFFRPEALFWRPNASSPAAGDLFVASPYAVYEASPPASPPLRVRRLASADWPPGARLLCGGGNGGAQPGVARCLLGALTPGGLALWPASEPAASSLRVELPVRGAPWEAFAGALAPCAALTGLLARPRVVDAQWCLFLAGIAGNRIPLAAVPLAAKDGNFALPDGTDIVRPLTDIDLAAEGTCPAALGAAGAKAGAPPPLACGSASRAIALHVEPTRPKLWILLPGGDLRAWDLASFTVSGRFAMQWPAYAGNTSAISLCVRSRERLSAAGAALSADDEREVLVAGYSSEVGPRLWRGSVPLSASTAARSQPPPPERDPFGLQAAKLLADADAALHGRPMYPS